MHNDHNMKRSELEAIIREAVNEVLNEADISPAEKTAKDAEMKAIDAKIKALQTKKGDLASGREEITEDNIDELANVAVRYELAPDAAAADFAGKKARIVSAMQATEEPMSKMDVASALGYDKQKGGVAGDMSDEEIEASFAKAMRSGEEEPEAGEIETGGVSAASMSDEDYEAFMQYTDLESRLAKLKSDILKTKRSRRDVGDISDEPSSVENMRAIKDKLQKKMNDLLASSEYLRKRQAKLTGKPVEEPKTDDEEPLDEWMKGRMQYYAGIKK